ncbi:hypothetical protein GTP41_11035 [Pseudoduganella sp. DS3]|uniref:Uncharacterized protein n=1 Tax=Pseudoduganella guangdongensis TaxID=2692179 RepID=A0A6N9HHY8_9BURK|nr:2-keto-3-deoxygluconate permease [Pseudoduganella guangdongensis]MYN02632.1 hypothetical protein [Pseudoduganella guangdongensis]
MLQRKPRVIKPRQAPILKEQLWLLVTAIACALVAWAFWRYLDSDAIVALMTLALVSAVADNLRLRRKLRENRQRD